MTLKLGLKAPRPGAVKQKFVDYFDTAKLQEPPANFGHERLVGNNWGMLANGPDPTCSLAPEGAGDCAIAAALHAVRLWNLERGFAIPITSDCAIQNYSSITGYNPDDPESDQGTDLPTLLHYWLTKGLVDAAGRRHLIGAAVELEPGNWEQLWYASYYLDGVIIGINCPQQWMDAFGQSNGEGVVWDALKNPDVEGGHAILDVAHRDGNSVPVSWGSDGIELTNAGFTQACNQLYAVASQEKLNNGEDLEGQNWSALREDVKELPEVLSDSAPKGKRKAKGVSPYTPPVPPLEPPPMDFGH